MHGRLPILGSTDDLERIANRWPRIRRFLRIDPTGGFDDDFRGWSSCVEPKLGPGERAAAYEEWADFWEWHLAQREQELAADRRKRHLVEKWTDSMAYSCRRSAAWARGEHPGKWLPQAQRRPDLYAEWQAIVAELDVRHRSAPAKAG